MRSVFVKEIRAFFSSFVAYIVVGVFLLTLGLFMWVFKDTSILESNYISMDGFFNVAPMIFVFLIPAITMSSFAEEFQRGTIEVLSTKPLSDHSILMGKFLANAALVLFAILPTILYYISLYYLGSPVGNIDAGATFGSYIGLISLAFTFVLIGMFASTLTQSQIVAFVIGVFLCFIAMWGFQFLSGMPIWSTSMERLIDTLGMNSHYLSISKGMIDTRDLIYFLSIMAVFYMFCFYSFYFKKI